METHASISLVGMSGAGKTRLARRLTQHGFEHFCVDDAIAAQLVERIGRPLDSLSSVADWMGFPDSPTYADRSALYQACEAAAVHAALERLVDAPRTPTRLVVDTTGSVIYLDTDLLARLQAVTTVIHLATPTRARQQMLDAFRDRPTPLIWGTPFSREDLFESYSALIKHREAEYARWADLTLDFQTRRDDAFDPMAYLAAQGLTS